MTLPRNPTLTWLLSFWCTANGALALLVAVSAALSGWSARSAAVLVVIALVAAAGALRLQLAAAAYRHWNRVATLYTALLRAGLTGASYAVVASASSVSRMPRSRGRPGATAVRPSWQRKRSPGIETYERRRGLRATCAWISRYVAWSRASENLWSVSLLPFVLLLLTLETREDTSVPERLYTLY